MADQTNYCLICEETASRLEKLQDNLHQIHQKNVDLLNSQIQVAKNLASVQMSMIKLKHQRNVLYYFIANCVETGDMTKDVRDLIKELKRTEV